MMKKSLEHLEFLIGNIQSTLPYFGNSNPSQIQKVVIGFLERLSFISINLKFTLEKIFEIPQLEFVAGLAIRTIVLDILITWGLVADIIEKESENLSREDLDLAIENFSNYILSDGLQSTINYLEKAHKIKRVDAETVILLFNSMVNSYKEYFKEYKFDGSKPEVKYKGRISAAALFDKLADNPETNHLADIYDAYVFYSKYDHFSIQHFTIINVDFKSKLDHIQKSIGIFILHQMNLFFILHISSRKDEFLYRKFKISEEYLQKIDPENLTGD